MKKLLIVSLVLGMLLLPLAQAFATEQINCWFPPDWQGRTEQAQAITAALSADSGITIHPIIAKSYPEILSAFSTDEENLVYVGSFVQAIINARGLGKALVQSQNGKSLYAGIMIYPEGQNPEEILQNNPREIAYAVGASSGESTAKAATAGRATISTLNHGASCEAIKTGVAKAAVVKNWWWEANKDRYAGLTAYEIPKFSYLGNPDNVLTASNAVPKASQEKIIVAAMKNSKVFNAQSVSLFDANTLKFSLWLMKQGKIDPMTYNW